MSAMLYQLTANAAQMCTPVPAAAPGGFGDWLDHWQTLVGAAIGGALGVLGAMIVARAQRRREQRVAAGMVLPDLQQLDAAGQSLERRARDAWPDQGAAPQVRETIQALRVVAALRLLPIHTPKLFALHTPAIGQLSDVDARLYGHLFMCQMVHRRFEDTLASRETLPDDPRNMEQRDFELLANWRLCVEHAALARFWLEHLVFSPWPRWIAKAHLKWLSRGIRKRPDESGPDPVDLLKRSAHLRAEGKILDTSAAAQANQL